MKNTLPLRRHVTRKRLIAAASLTLVGALALTGCSGSGGAKIDASAPKHLSGTVSLWHFFTGREAGVVQTAVKGFEKKYPDVKVDVHSGQDDTKLQQAISSGQNIDVGISYSTAIVGSFCSSGAFLNLGQYIKRDKVDLSDIPKVVRGYTSYKGNQCTLPALADTSGLLMNTKELAAKGITTPPKTLDELEADGLKLTTYNSDGSIKQLGFNPLMSFEENSPEHFAPMINGTWLSKSGKSEIGTSAGWKKLIEWQKAYVDKIGYAKLQAFTSGLGQEFAADNPFQTGQVSMVIDGEYRTAFIQSQKPDLQYSSAPTPVMSGYGTYGASYIAGNVAGIAKGSKHPELAWALLKYLALNTDAQVQIGNGLKNVPTITSALDSPKLEVDKNYKTFIDAAKNPATITSPATSDGAAYIGTFTKMWTAYQSGGGDLTAQLKTLDKNIDNENALTGP
ncbi:sugar ABC transporter substrate-binding protein [Frondihabitans sp. PAMC 28766]|uniref:extracellular solute-binding protein n=1 Tax=Frondihabitans sp. PAMC 28766 TaxID=1795630 RepID=UPI00078E918D|nr:extracellular solute-binding protein [Frondihabitans sp. PAMC 28766]AMM19882.1 sugar ABC transporter substrate-binding protein [Frondihabitans sp. PAMC 28766]